jgi:hypothetical protein
MAIQKSGLSAVGTVYTWHEREALSCPLSAVLGGVRA